MIMTEVYGMAISLAQRIASRLETLSKNPSGVALEAGLGRSSVRDIIVGKVEHPRIDTLRKLTGPLACSLEYLTGDSDEPGEPDPHHKVTNHGYFDTQEVLSFRSLQIGTYKAANVSESAGSQLRWEDAPNGDRELQPNERYLIYNDFRLPDWRTTLYRIEDYSLLDFGIRPGDFLTVASPTGETIIPLKHGTIVIVSHIVSGGRGQQPLVEMTARLVEVHPDGVRLTSRSKDNFPPIFIRDDDLDELLEKALPNTYYTDSGTLGVEGIAVRVTRDLPV
jgi:hypothetical protein